MRKKEKREMKKKKSQSTTPLGCADNNNTDNSIVPKAQNVK